MTDKLNWGIIGTGAIAKTLANALAKSRTGKLIAVASRTQEKANEFGESFQLSPNKRYADYAALLADKDIQAVYIATPHPLHAPWTIKALEAGKHVLAEKPMAVNQYHAQAMVETALKHNRLLTEAFMYRCHPQTHKLIELLKQKAIGDVRVIQATFSFQAGFNADGRLYKNSLAGGGILDIGCYPVSMVRLLAGAATGTDFADPLDLKALGHLESTGVDGYTLAVLKFPGEILAQIAGGIAINQDNVVRIFGTQGRIFLPNPWVADRAAPSIGKIIVQKNGEPQQEIDCPAEVTTFTLEVDVFGDAALAGKIQVPAPAMTWSDSLGNIATLDAWRSQIGVVYDFEKPENYSTNTVADRPLKISPQQKMLYGSLPNITKKISRLVMGVDNQRTMPHAMTMFDAFYEQGGNTFDTAFIYGGGVMEPLLGHWIKIRNLRNEVVVIAKGGHTPECNPPALVRQLTKSLERLQTDYTDIYIMHRDNPEIPVGEFVDVLNQQVKAGRIKAFGGSNWSLQRIEEANNYAKKHNLQPFSLVSNNFSLARMVEAVWGGCIAASDPASRTWLTKAQFPLFAWSSQARGFFTDRAHKDKSLNDEEMNRCWYSDDNWQRRDRVLELAKKKNVLPISIALAYVLRQPFPTFALIGPRTLEELRTSLPALNIELTATEVEWLNLA